MSSSAVVDRGIFKAYDIRGLYPQQIDEVIAYKIGRSFACVLASEVGQNSTTDRLRVGLGRDMRSSSPKLSAAFAAGLLDQGCEVTDIGMVGTEMLYYLVGSRELDGGATITASHNPKAYTGVKLVRQRALALSGETGINEIGRQVAEDDFAEPTTAGSVEKIDIYDEYRQRTMQLIDPTQVKPMKLVLDGGSGMVGPMILPILEQLPLELVKNYMEPDGEFPGHEPNPLLEENREEIIANVREQQADLGIAWDGDADRCFFIDGRGQFVAGDFLTALLAKQILKKAPGATVLYDVRASRAVRDTVEECGGKARVNRVGHSFFKQRMRSEGAVFGGEVSGHYYFRDFWCADSGVIPALLMLELLSDENRSLADMVEEFRKHYFISGEINSKVANADEKIEALAQRYGDGDVSYLDGVSVDYESWHFNVRPSNTEPLLRLNLEASSQAELDTRLAEVLAVIRGD